MLGEREEVSAAPSPSCSYKSLRKEPKQFSTKDPRSRQYQCGEWAPGRRRGLIPGRSSFSGRSLPGGSRRWASPAARTERSFCRGARAALAFLSRLPWQPHRSHILLSSRQGSERTAPKRRSWDTIPTSGSPVLASAADGPSEQCLRAGSRRSSRRPLSAPGGARGLPAPRPHPPVPRSLPSRGSTLRNC